MERNYSAETKNIIALCHIIDYFEGFRERLIPMISHGYNRDFVFQLYDVSLVKFRLGASKAKQFYRENKAIIDTINRYSNISRFINDNYGWFGKSEENLEFFYEYISNHKDEMDKILAVLCKLNELGFDRFEFNENLDFTTEMYGIQPSFKRNHHITYVANPEVIPSYDSYITFRTTSSNYKMDLHVIGDEISRIDEKIILNSLLFDPKSFPESVNRENTFEHILELKDAQREQTDAIRNSVNLNVSVENLDMQLVASTVVISKLDGVENKGEMLTILESIREDVEKLKALSLQHDSRVSEQQPLVTSEVLEKEKALYLRRRDMSNIDSC